MIYDEDVKFYIKEDVEYYMNKYRNRNKDSMYNKICTTFSLIYVDSAIVPCSKCRYCEMYAVEGMSARYAV